jgi:hypothetical protein
MSITDHHEADRDADRNNYLRESSNMPIEAYGPKYTYDEARTVSPAFRNAAQYDRFGAAQIPPEDHPLWNHWHVDRINGLTTEVRKPLVTINERYKESYWFVGDHGCVSKNALEDNTHLQIFQRKAPDVTAITTREEAIAKRDAASLKEETEKALAQPNIKFALMPKLEELQGKLDALRLQNQEHGKITDGMNKTVEDIKGNEIPEIKKKLAVISNKAGRADGRLDFVEENSITLEKKVDTLQADMHEMKNTLAEILIAIKRPASPSRN